MTDGLGDDRAAPGGVRPDATELNRATSHALRHEPWLYELELDDDGWVAVDDLVAALRRTWAEGAGLTPDDVARVVADAPKQRHELRAGRVRALYGHSLPGRLRREPAEPPGLVYHGTSAEAMRRIRAKGLRPMVRQYVHLSADLDTA